MFSIKKYLIFGVVLIVIGTVLYFSPIIIRIVQNFLNSYSPPTQNQQPNPRQPVVYHKRARAF